MLSATFFLDSFSSFILVPFNSSSEYIRDNNYVLLCSKSFHCFGQKSVNTLYMNKTTDNHAGRLSYSSEQSGEHFNRSHCTSSNLLTSLLAPSLSSKKKLSVLISINLYSFIQLLYIQTEYIHTIHSHTHLQTNLVVHQ